MDRDWWSANTDNIVIADPLTKTLTWIPRDLWCPSINHRINKTFALGGVEGLVRGLRELGFSCDHGLVLRRGATERAAIGLSVEVPVKRPLDFWYPLHPTQPIEDGKKLVTFRPPSERLEGERIHQWVGARNDLFAPSGRGRTSDRGRMQRQQVFLRALLTQKFDFASVIADPNLVRGSGDEALGELASIDLSWRMRSFTNTRSETIEGKAILVRRGEQAERDEKADPPQLAVVVIALGAPAETVDAVRSLLAQTPRVEIVVVNSGGGGMAELLARHGIEVPVVEHAERLYAGAARNIGIRATRAPYVAFLASDCRATDGWARERLVSHHAGAAAVTTAVVNGNPYNPFAWAGHLALWSRRMPNTRMGLPYGASYDRRLFDELGYFREDLRAGEDSEFNRRLPTQPKWRGTIHTLHLNPTRFISLIADQFRRGARAAQFQQECWGTTLPSDLGAWRRRTMRTFRASRQVSTQYRAYVWLARPLIPVAVAAYCLGARSWQRRNETEAVVASRSAAEAIEREAP